MNPFHALLLILYSTEVYACVLKENQVVYHVWVDADGKLHSSDPLLQNNSCTIFGSEIRYSTGLEGASYVGTVLVVGLPFRWTAWYHVLLEHSLPALRVLYEEGYLTNSRSSQDAPPFAVLFQGETHSMWQSFAEFWRYIAPSHVWLSTEEYQTWSHGTNDGRPLYFEKLIVPRTTPTYGVSNLTRYSDWVPTLRAIQARLAARLLPANGQRQHLHHSLAAESDSALQLPPHTQHQREKGDTQKQFNAILVVRDGMRAFAEGQVDVVEGLMRDLNMQVLVDKLEGSFADQWLALHQADLLVGVHGSALTDTVFMRPGSAVIEIHPNGWADIEYANWAVVLGLRYFNFETAQAKRQRQMECEAQGITKQDCQPGLRGMSDLCCIIWWRDQESIIDSEAFAPVLADARDVHYLPVCNWVEEVWETHPRNVYRCR